eukprot:SAG11_NODE_2625_length_3164_cov_3.186623_3_plen_186_part_00
MNGRGGLPCVPCKSHSTLCLVPKAPQQRKSITRRKCNTAVILPCLASAMTHIPSKVGVIIRLEIVAQGADKCLVLRLVSPHACGKATLCAQLLPMCTLQCCAVLAHRHPLLPRVLLVHRLLYHFLWVQHRAIFTRTAAPSAAKRVGHTALASSDMTSFPLRSSSVTAACPQVLRNGRATYDARQP